MIYSLTPGTVHDLVMMCATLPTKGKREMIMPINEAKSLALTTLDSQLLRI